MAESEKKIIEQRHISELGPAKTAVEGAHAAGSIFGSTAFLIIIIVLLFGGGGISLFQEIVKNVPLVVILGLVAIIFIFKR